jgi:hypothetical protein
MISFNDIHDIHGFCCEFQATFPATVCYCIICIITEENPRLLLPCGVVLFL